MTAARRYHSTDPRQLLLLSSVSGDWVSAAPENDVAPRARAARRLKRPLPQQLVLFSANGMTWIEARGPAQPPKPMSISGIIKALGGQHRSGAQREAMQAEIQHMYDKLQAHACVMYGDELAALMTFKLFTKIDKSPPKWLHGLFLEQRDALVEAFEGNTPRDRDEDMPNTDMYEEEDC